MGRELLLVEPDAVVAETVRRAFTPAGFDVEILGAGEAAVDRCRASRPALVLLSAELPDMSDFSVCNRIKRSVPDLPVMLYTGEDAAAAVAAHRLTRTRADEYVRAPLDVATVVARAAQLVGDGVAVAPSQDATAGAEPGGPDAPPPGPPPLRTSDAVTRVKDAILAQRAEAAQLRERVESLRRQGADAERARVELERLLGEARTALDDVEARRADLERRLADSESTRQALSDVLNETMQHAETSDREWSQRVAAAEEGRARLEAQLAAERAGAEERLARLREERDALAGELEAERASRAAELESAVAAATARGQSAAEGAAEAERRRQLDLARHKEALVDLERRLEASARAEASARRRLAELERERAEPPPEGERLKAVEEALARTREELDDLRTENDFLNGEVARYVQKNRELLAQLSRS